MGDEKQPDDVQSDLSIATESLKIEGDQKDNGEAGKTDKFKIPLSESTYNECRLYYLNSVGESLSTDPVKTKVSTFDENETSEFSKRVLGAFDILLKATGNAPIMKKKKWAVDAEKQIGWIMEFVKKYLKLEPDEKLFLYVNQTFAPSPDQIVKNLYECFGTDGKLVLHYCKSQAWG